MRAVEPDWSFSVQRWGGDGPQRQHNCLSALVWAKVRELPEDLQGDARRAWPRRWNMVLGCAAARAVAMSLLDFVPGGSDGATPSVHTTLFGTSVVLERDCRRLVTVL